MPDKILFVDDDANVLSSYKRTLREYDVTTALGAQEGLNAITAYGPFAVILADMRMPGMDGIQFLARARELAPDSVRMMLTGHADLETAVQAVNEGSIFRFLTKPCAKESLLKALGAATEQYRLVVVERQLLEETLNGSIKVLTDLLALVNPAAFGRASRLRRYAEHIAAALRLPDAWKFEVAAMLSQIGCVTLQTETLEKLYAGQELDPREQLTYDSHPTVAGKLLVSIPRLEEIAHMIARQHEPFIWDPSGAEPRHRDIVSLGGQILKVSLDFDKLISRGLSPIAATDVLRKKPDEYDPEIVAALAGLEVRPPGMEARVLNIDDLDAHMILDQDVHARNGNLLVTRGQELTIPVLMRLRHWAQGVGVEEPVRVLVLKKSEASEAAASETLSQPQSLN